MEADWVLLEIMSSVGSSSDSLVVTWDDMTSSKMDIEVPGHGSEAKSLSFLKGHAAIFTKCSVIQITPCSSWEIKVSLVLTESVGLN